MSVRSFTKDPKTKHRLAMQFALLFLLLWGLQASVVHSHYDEPLEVDSVCQLCLHSATSNCPLPSAGLAALPVLSGAITPALPEKSFIASHTRIINPRGPPAIS
ncbi:MAG: hypothetical protein ACI9W6_002234 [Motiliproteus sp.]|jgi:hypothetical protein